MMVLKVMMVQQDHKEPQDLKALKDQQVHKADKEI